MKIGVMVESFRLEFADALAAAAKVGCQGVQIYVPGQWTADQIKEHRTKLDDSGLEVSAVCAEFGEHGFMVAEDNPARVDRTKRAIDEGLALGTNVVTSHIGVVPADKSHPRFGVMASACEQIARYAGSVGATFAIETGPETGRTLRAFIDEIGVEGLGVNFDPANLAMVIAEDVVDAVRQLGPFIVHTHAKDGVNLRENDGEVAYGAVAAPEGVDPAAGFEEVPLGEGDVPWPEYIAALKEVGFDGYLTIEREVGKDPAADIKLAVGFLKGLGCG
ncbi:MAG: sugar phosphate isomerase/epimerase [Phycisphaerae bacterium]|nr:sugar phosphate isomerase/epimerase [Phycisphaerae bacterium]